jgi:ubiquinone/menaquinone biosynthesis C-methylase UbiE
MKNQTNTEIWDHRYKSKFNIAEYPFDQIVSMVMRRFKSVDDRSMINALDYGCGGGNNFWFLAKEGFAAYALDIAPSALKLTEQRIQAEGLHLPEDRYRLLDGERLPFPDHFFSLIIDRESLCQSAWPEIQSRVREFRRILKPGGWYFGVNFTCHHPDICSADPLGSGDWHNFRHGLFKGQGHRHMFSVNEISNLFGGWHIDSLAELRISSIIGGGGG